VSGDCLRWRDQQSSHTPECCDADELRGPRRGEMARCGQAVAPELAGARRAAGEAAQRAAALAAVEAVLWGAAGGGPRRLLGAARRRLPRRTLAQRLAARAAAALAADFAVDLGDVLLSLSLDEPHSRVGAGYPDLGSDASAAASGRAGSGGGAASAGDAGGRGDAGGGARVVLRVRELALEGASVWCSPELTRPSAAQWPAALDASLRLRGLCLGVAAAGGARAAPAAPPAAADGREPPRAGEVSIVHRWSAGATLRWRAGGAARSADAPPAEAARAAGAAHARSLTGAHAAASPAAPAPAAAAGGEAEAEIAASALMVAGDAAALATVLAAAAGLARFCAFRSHRCTRPQVRLPAAVPLSPHAGGADALYIPCRPAWHVQWAWICMEPDINV